MSGVSPFAALDIPLSESIFPIVEVSAKLSLHPNVKYDAFRYAELSVMTAKLLKKGQKTGSRLLKMKKAVEKIDKGGVILLTLHTLRESWCGEKVFSGRGPVNIMYGSHGNIQRI